jgi:predicted  nucleic acid-binding Zn-ribbon protein
MTSIAELYRLQEVDLALQAARDALTDVQSRLGEPEELIEARRVAEERQAALRVAEKDFKEREWEADEQRRKIEVPEQRLYEGKVSNPKELEDLQQDVESLKRRRSVLEDEAFAAMERLDEAERALGESQRQLEELTGTTGVEQEELRARQTTLESEIASLEGQRAELAAGSDDVLLDRYDELRAGRQGRAVAKVQGGSCQGCRILLPVNLIQRARAGDGIVQCNNCERILYVS